MNSNRIFFLGAILGASLLLLTSRCAKAAHEPITFSICEGKVLSFKQPKGTDRLEVRCPGKAEPSLTVVGCIGPAVRRIGTAYTVTCKSVVPYPQVRK